MAFLATQDEIQEFTKCITPGAQFAVLKAMKVKHFENMKKLPVVASVALEQAKREGRRSHIIPSLEHVTGLQSMPRNGVGIYFLCLDEEIVYIGKTTNFFGRMAAHDGSEYTFDSVKFLPAPEKNLDMLEREYIARLRPKFNKRHNKAAQCE